jgi:hypothetical protein
LAEKKQSVESRKATFDSTTTTTTASTTTVRGPLAHVLESDALKPVAAHLRQSAVSLRETEEEEDAFDATYFESLARTWDRPKRFYSELKYAL